MIKIIIKIGNLILSACYFLLKLFPTKNRITFLSRQQNSPSLDIRMLCAQLKQLKGNDLSIITLCKKLEHRPVKVLSYGFHIFVQMYYMATSKVIVLDGYCIAASLLNHRSSLKIVQMWHALGSLKKFGYSILGQEEGSSSEIAEIMRMHKNYDYIFTSSQHCIKAFAEAFGYPEEALEVMSLPRVDALLDKERDKEKVRVIHQAYPQLSTDNKKTILYAPTFRKNYDMTDAVRHLIDAIDYDNYNLVIKMHPLTDGELIGDGVIWDKRFSTMDMLAVSDMVITDYSAVTYEAALKEKTLFFYAFDLDEYIQSRSFYIDYLKEMPGPIEKEADKVIKAIEEEKLDSNKIRLFADKYVDKQKDCTHSIAEFLLSLLE